MSENVECRPVPTKDTVARALSKRARQEGNKIIRHDFMLVVGEGVDEDFGEEFPEHDDEPRSMRDIM